MAGTSKQNQRQSKHRAPKYTAQRDVTPINKAINVARHISRYADSKQKDALRKMDKVTLTRAARKLFDRGELTGIVSSVRSGARTILLEVAA